MQSYDENPSKKELIDLLEWAFNALDDQLYFGDSDYDNAIRIKEIIRDNKC
jgi:hypothetical protein